MHILREHPKTLMLFAYTFATAVVVAIVLGWGGSGFFHAFDTTHPLWLILVAGGSIAAPMGYALCYRSLTRVGEVPELPAGLSARIVAMGFGPFVPAGGLHADRRALERIDGDGASARKHVFAIGLLELALMTPVAWLCALIMLLNGDKRPMPSELWPWVVLVPVGFAIAFAGIAWVRHSEPDDDRGGIRGGWARLCYGASMLLELPTRPRGGWLALLGMAAYWLFDIAAFCGATAFIGLHISLAEAILGYATGYALTRRSMPLGGAGVTEALLTFALHWVGQPILPALAAVVVYRVFNFLLPALPALRARERVAPLVGQPA